MRTIRDLLAETEPEKVADILFQQHLRTLIEQADPSDTVADSREVCRKWTARVCSRIADASSDETSPFVFLAVPAAADGSWWIGYGAVDAVMCDRNEILRGRPLPEAYGWLAQSYAEIANSLIAETPLTKENRDEILADIFWELTWFGDTDEERQNYMDNLGGEDEGDEDEDEEGLTSEELERLFAVEKTVLDKKEQALTRRVNKADHKRYTYCFQRELKQVRKLLERES